MWAVTHWKQHCKKLHWRIIQELPRGVNQWQLMEPAEDVCPPDTNGDPNRPISSFDSIFLLNKMGSYCLLIVITLKFTRWKCSRSYLIFYHGSILQYSKSVAILILLLISILISRIRLHSAWQPAHLSDDFASAVSSHPRTWDFT